MHLRPTNAVLSDINADLISTLNTVRENSEKVLAAIWRFSNTRECYERVRRSKPRSEVAAAARFIFLNRTCWGGVYRLNRRGEFNVPFGNSGRVICRGAQLSALAKSLDNTELIASDFESVINRVRRGDVCYADPPYTTKGANNGFLRYNERLFSWDDQIRLAYASRAAASRGGFIVVSALWHDGVLDLYRGWWACKVRRTVCVGRNIRSRVPIDEALVFSRLPRMSTLFESEIRKL